MQIIEKVHLPVLIFSALMLVNTTSQANTLADASNLELLKAACPHPWEDVSKTIAPDEHSPRPVSVPWLNEPDRQKHFEFQRNFIIPQTKTGSTSMQAVSDDVITVLSECLKRHNYVVRDEFNKTIGELPDLKEKPFGAIHLLLNQYLVKRLPLQRERTAQQKAEEQRRLNAKKTAVQLILSQYLNRRSNLTL